jgi:hypothetical protein
VQRRRAAGAQSASFLGAPSPNARRARSRPRFASPRPGHARRGARALSDTWGAFPSGGLDAAGILTWPRWAAPPVLLAPIPRRLPGPCLARDGARHRRHQIASTPSSPSQHAEAMSSPPRCGARSRHHHQHRGRVQRLGRRDAPGHHDGRWRIAGAAARSMTTRPRDVDEVRRSPACASPSPGLDAAQSGGSGTRSSCHSVLDHDERVSTLAGPPIGALRGSRSCLDDPPRSSPSRERSSTDRTGGRATTVGCSSRDARRLRRPARRASLRLVARTLYAPARQSRVAGRSRASQAALRDDARGVVAGHRRDVSAVRREAARVGHVVPSTDDLPDRLRRGVRAGQPDVTRSPCVLPVAAPQPDPAERASVPTRSGRCRRRASPPSRAGSGGVLKSARGDRSAPQAAST